MSSSTPDSDTRLEAWAFLLTSEGRRLLEAARDVRGDDVSMVARLRRQWTRDQVAAAVELVETRRRGRGRFEDIDQIIADREGLQQASGTAVARYKARRIADEWEEDLLDLCCGIGGDAREFARVMNVVGIDRDPLRCWMTHVNAGCETRCGDLEDLDLPAGPIHIDPSRRVPGGARRHDPTHWHPSASHLTALLSDRSHALVKMGPGVDLAQLPFCRDGDEIEFVSDEGTLVQALLWRRPGPSPRRRATRLAHGTKETLIGDGDDAPDVQSPQWDGRWLHVPDPALERAGLLGQVSRPWALSEPAAGLGLLLGKEPAASPWLIPYAIAHALPWRPKRIQEWLHRHDAGTVEVRTRGGAITGVDAWRSRFRGPGRTPWTIFGLRLDQVKVAVITHPRGSRPEDI